MAVAPRRRLRGGPPCRTLLAGSALQLPPEGAQWPRRYVLILNARAVAGLAWSLCLFTLGVLGSSVVLWAANDFPVLLGTDAATGGPGIRLLAVLTFSLIAIIGLLIATRQPKSPIGWIVLVADVVSSFDLFAQNFAAYALSRTPDLARVVAALAYPLNVSAALIAVMLLLFPGGRLLSAQWRIVVWLAITSGLLQLINRAVRPGVLRMAPSEQNPFGLQIATPFLPITEAAAQIGLALALLLAAASLVLRWRRARGDERQQLQWIACAVPPWIVVFAASIAAPQSLQPIVRVVYFLVLDLFVIALGVAMLKYRLYEIDIVINKAMFATVIVAVAFQSVRERAQRIANRLVYGRRASPYEVLANFSQGLAVAVSPDELLPRMARATALGLGAARARVRVYVPGSFDRAVGWPPDMINAAFERTVPVLHQGALVGEISVSKSSSEPFTRTEERLLADLAAQSGAGS